MNFLSTFSTRCSLAAALILASSFQAPALAQTQAADQPDAPVLDTSVEVPNGTLDPIETPIQDSLTQDNESEGSEPIASESETDTTNYTDAKLSVDYPTTWQLKKLEDGIIISSVATAPAELVATQIVRMAAPPGAVVNANIESFTEEGSAVARYSRATIDGQDALVMWLAERPDELGSAIATFIGYENETVLLFSRYAPENTTAEADILQIHTSFTDPATANSATEETPSANSTEADLLEDSEIEEIVPANGSPVE